MVTCQGGVWTNEAAKNQPQLMGRIMKNGRNVTVEVIFKPIY